jgi:hypothetical protein
VDRFEKNLLQGLHQEQPAAGTWAKYHPCELRWLDGKSVRQVKRWRRDNPAHGLRRWPETQHLTLHDMEREKKSCEHIMPAVSQLLGMGLIASSSPPTPNFELTLTAQGVDVARKCSTRRGRADLWYRDHKEGLGGLLVTVLVSGLVSFLVAVAANFIMD